MKLKDSATILDSPDSPASSDIMGKQGPWNQNRMAGTRVERTDWE